MFEIDGRPADSAVAANFSDVDLTNAMFSLEVRTSQLGEGTGNGLFCREPIPAGSRICVYCGRILHTREAMRLQDKSYLMKLGPQLYVDALGDESIAARYINDCRNPAVYNVYFDKRPDEEKAYVTAQRDISTGEELFVDYGRWYWASLKPQRLPFAIAAEILQKIEHAKSKIPDHSIAPDETLDT